MCEYVCEHKFVCVCFDVCVFVRTSVCVELSMNVFAGLKKQGFVKTSDRLGVIDQNVLQLTGTC